MEGDMKKIFLFGLIVYSFFSCRPRQDRVDSIKEDGVEIVLNHQEPYTLRGEPSALTLQKQFSIDTEDDSIAAKGATDIFSFTVDQTGNIYLLRPPTGPGDLIFKFSNTGEFMTSFGRMGQGPNEMEYPGQILAVRSDKIWVLESPKNKYHVFDKSGNPIEEKNVNPGFDQMFPLENGNFLVSRLVAEDMTTKYFPIVLNLCGADFQPVKELDRFKSYPNRQLAASLPEKIVCGTGFVFLGKVGSDQIYVGNSERGYEILIYDLGGELQRKIRKEYTPVPVSDQYKKDYLKPYEEYMPDYAKKIYFPENWHPFRSFFVDDAGRLFVMTYEEGENPDENWCDIFNKEGILISRKSLNIVAREMGTILAASRRDNLYCVQQKKSGYKELVVYRMIWK